MNSQAKRYVALDGLRGLAAVLVLLFHLRWAGDHTIWAGHLPLFPFVDGGYLAVDLFFILSGFVLASSYLYRMSTATQAAAFFRMRFFRIYPLHIFALLVLIGLELIKLAGMMAGRMPSTHIPFSSPNTVGDIGLNVFLLHSLGFTDHESWNGPSWSISCEAAGYVCFAAAASGRMLRSRVFKWVAIPIALVCYGMLLAQRGTLDVTYDLGIVRCLAGMMLGVWIYDVSRTPFVARISDASAGTLASFAAGCLVIALCFNKGPAQIFAIPAFVATILFLQRDSGLVAVVLGSAPLRFLGKISYSTYLMQIPVMSVLGILTARWLMPHSATPTDGTLTHLWIGDLYTVCVLAAVIAVATITYNRIEAPWLRYGRGRKVIPDRAVPSLPQTSRQPTEASTVRRPRRTATG